MSLRICILETDILRPEFIDQYQGYGQMFKHLFSQQPIAASFEVRFGRAADEIVIQAKEDKVDLVVMGSHGRSGLSHLLVGSVAESVVRHAPCPVLVVR